MGIGSPGAMELLYLRHKYMKAAGERILQLGRQDMYFDFDTLVKCAGLMGVGLANVNVNLVINPWTKLPVIDDQTFFSALGFTEIGSMDFVEDENPTVVHDLNEPLFTAPKLHEQWDVIYDGGTLEHVFDISTAFSNVHALLKPGGIAVHVSPTNNLVDHGFWQVNPTALVSAYAANGYEILNAWVTIFEEAADYHKIQPRRFLYEHEAFAQRAIGGLPTGVATTCVMARKPNGDDKPFTRPVQEFYRRHWSIGQDSQNLKIDDLEREAMKVQRIEEYEQQNVAPVGAGAPPEAVVVEPTSKSSKWKRIREILTE